MIKKIELKDLVGKTVTSVRTEQHYKNDDITCLKIEFSHEIVLSISNGDLFADEGVIHIEIK